MDKYEISPTQYVLYKSLIGDRSDNITGIRGIGPVSSRNIVKYKTLSNFILKNPHSKYTKQIIENEEKIKMNIELITLNKNLDTSKVKIKKMNHRINKYTTSEIIEHIKER